MSEQLDLFNKRQRYQCWDVLDELPEGWVIDKTAGSPLARSVFITNGKSLISGNQKRAILRVRVNPIDNKEDDTGDISDLRKKEEVKPSIFPAKTVNELARAKFKEQILKEIMFDLMVCEIEEWDKKEYINELQKMLNGIKLTY